MEDATSGAEPAPQRPPRLAPASSSRQRDPPRGQSLPPEKRSAGPSGDPETHTQCPHFQPKEHHGAPPPVLGRQSPGGLPQKGTRIVFVPFHIPPGCWLIAPALGGAVSFLSIRPGAQGGWGGSENPAEAPRPSLPPHSHQCRPCLASQVALGGRGGLEVPLSEMEKCHQAAAPPPSPTGWGGGPPGWPWGQPDRASPPASLEKS